MWETSAIIILSIISIIALIRSCIWRRLFLTTNKDYNELDADYDELQDLYHKLEAKHGYGPKAIEVCEEPYPQTHDR